MEYIPHLLGKLRAFMTSQSLHFDMNPNRHDNKIGNLGLRNGINSKQ